MRKEGAAAYLVIPRLPSRQNCALNWFHRHKLHSRLLLLQVSSRAHDSAPSAHACVIASIHIERDIWLIALQRAEYNAKTDVQAIAKAAGQGQDCGRFPALSSACCCSNSVP